MTTQNRPITKQHTRGFQTTLLGTLIVLFSIPIALAEHDKSIDALRQMGKAFASIAEKASPAVVGIKAEKIISSKDYPIFREFPFHDPFYNPFGDDFFERFFGPRWRQRLPKQQPQTETTQGSGFIISPDGYILTNNHLVGGAQDDKVMVIMKEDEREVTGKVVGTDPESDVAVVKIEVDEDLPYVQLADSDTLEVGEWVIAIGNPFGLSHSVTAGIVSAKGRNRLNLGIGYQDFIQTDAAINPGNSGGPLLNLNGKAVGINTAILGPGSNLGIGFAIPINMARSISDQLITTGKVVRGYLGISMKNLTDDIIESLDLNESHGALIIDIGEDTPAEKAGLKRYDIIVEVNGETIENSNALQNKIAAYKPDTQIDITVIRDGKRKTINVKLGERTPEALSVLAGDSNITKDLGMEVTTLTDEIAERYGYEELKGVIISQIESGSDADHKGLRPGMLIMEVNRISINNVRDFNKVVEQAVKDNKKHLLLYITDGRIETMVTLKLPKD